MDEPTGAGRAVLFAFNPLFRAYTESGLHLVANALLYPATGGAARPAPDRTIGVDPARAAAATEPVRENLGGQWRPISIEVAVGDLARTEAVVGGFTDTPRTSVAGGSAYLVIPNPAAQQCRADVPDGGQPPTVRAVVTSRRPTSRSHRPAR